MPLITPSKAIKPGLLALLFSLTFLLPVNAAATEEARIAELEKKLEKSLALIEQLSARLNQLEWAKSAAAPVPAAREEPAAQDARLTQLEQRLLEVSDNAAKRNEIGLPLRGFADVGYAHADDSAGRKSGFALGTLDLYLTPAFGERGKSIVELALEYNAEGQLAVDLERLQFGYTFSDALTLWGGRFHTPLGYWNTAFHHGAQIQTSVLRPRLIDFEDMGGILPAHAVGLLASGGLRVGSGRLHYDAYLANGNRIVDGALDFNAVQDDNGNKLLGGNLRYAFGGTLEGLTVGVHGFSQQVDRAADPASGLGFTSTRVKALGAFAALERGSWELIGEYYGFRNRDLSGASGLHSSWAGFAQAGYTLGAAWTPFVRLEKAVLDQGDHYFLGQTQGGSYQRQALGLHYRLNPLAALKLEFTHTREEQRPSRARANDVRLQLAVRF